MKSVSQFVSQSVSQSVSCVSPLPASTDTRKTPAWEEQTAGAPLPESQLEKVLIFSCQLGGLVSGQSDIPGPGITVLQPADWGLVRLRGSVDWVW